MPKVAKDSSIPSFCITLLTCRLYLYSCIWLHFVFVLVQGGSCDTIWLPIHSFFLFVLVHPFCKFAFVLPQLCDKKKLPSRIFIVSMYLCIWLHYVFVFCTGGRCDKIRPPICSLFSLMTDFNLARIIFLASPPC